MTHHERANECDEAHQAWLNTPNEDRGTLNAFRAGYNRGFAVGSGDEGAYQREIAQLRADLKSAQAAWNAACHSLEAECGCGIRNGQYRYCDMHRLQKSNCSPETRICHCIIETRIVVGYRDCPVHGDVQKVSMLPCAHCGSSSDSLDQQPFPSSRKTDAHWICRCGDPACGAEVIGNTPKDAVTRWNRRVPLETRAPVSLAEQIADAQQRIAEWPDDVRIAMGLKISDKPK
jgi:hypothetical protein